MKTMSANPLLGWFQPVYEALKPAELRHLHVEAETLSLLLSEAAHALFERIVDNLYEVRPQYTERFIIASENPRELLADWLSELLAMHRQRRLAFSQFNVLVTAEGIEATAVGEPLDPQRHVSGREIVGISPTWLEYHDKDHCWTADLRLEL